MTWRRVTQQSFRSPGPIDHRLVSRPCGLILFLWKASYIYDILFFGGEYVCADMSIYMIQHVCIVMHMSKFYVKTYGHLHLWRFLGRKWPGQVWGWNFAVQVAHVLLMLFEVLKNLKHATWPGVVKHLRITFKCHSNGVPGRKAYVSKFIYFDIVGRYTWVKTSISLKIDAWFRWFLSFLNWSNLSVGNSLIFRGGCPIFLICRARTRFPWTMRGCTMGSKKLDHGRCNDSLDHPKKN